VKEADRFQKIDRLTITTYTLSTSLYLFVIAVPIAGGIFGSWLALTLNVIGRQHNEGFSSLRIQHFKNFLRCHIKENGDLEIFGIGLDRVPKSWVLDDEWGGSKAAKEQRDRMDGVEPTSDDPSLYEDLPSWKWGVPSKWKPEEMRQVNVPRLIDYTLIKKRHTQVGTVEEAVRPPMEKQASGKESFKKPFDMEQEFSIMSPDTW
jgi:hypothetical protein